MIESIQVTDPMYPFIDAPPGDARKRIPRPDWNVNKQIALNIRTIDYLMQFEEMHASQALNNLILGYYSLDYENADLAQKARYDELLAIQKRWRNKMKIFTCGSHPMISDAQLLPQQTHD